MIDGLTKAFFSFIYEHVTYTRVTIKCHRGCLRQPVGVANKHGISDNQLLGILAIISKKCHGLKSATFDYFPALKEPFLA